MNPTAAYNLANAAIAQAEQYASQSKYDLARATLEANSQAIVYYFGEKAYRSCLASMDPEKKDQLLSDFPLTEFP